MRHPADITPLTFLDYPKKAACIFWYTGCNLRCPYCYNPELVLSHGGGQDEMAFLRERAGFLDAVVLSGGESTLNPDIAELCREIKKRGFEPKGFDTVFVGDVPLGAGMSSSAALESTFANALNEIFNLNIDRFELARIGQSTEHNYCGVKCGIMDQFASVFGKKGHLMRLNCATMEFEYFPFNPEGYKVVLLDTVVKHELASSAYNKRRESCENACAHIKANHPEVNFLSDATMAMLDEVKAEISEEDYMRAVYVIGEKQRVLDVCAALEKGDYETVGDRMFGTHYGMSKEYEVSCEELDFLNDIAKQCGVTGSRVMGGGFGGCTINLVKEDLYDNFIATAKKEYLAKYNREPKVYDVVISDGARRIK